MCVRGYMSVRGCMCVRARLSSIFLFLVSLQKPPYVHLTQIKTRWKEKKSLGFLESDVECFLMPPHMYTPWDIKKNPKEIRGVANEQEHAAGERIWREDCV